MKSCEPLFRQLGWVRDGSSHFQRSVGEKVAS